MPGDLAETTATGPEGWSGAGTADGLAKGVDGGTSCGEATPGAGRMPCEYPQPEHALVVLSSCFEQFGQLGVAGVVDITAPVLTAGNL